MSYLATSACTRRIKAMTLEEERQFLVPTTTKPDDAPPVMAEKTENWPAPAVNLGA